MHARSIHALLSLNISNTNGRDPQLANNEKKRENKKKIIETYQMLYGTLFTFDHALNLWPWHAFVR